MTKPYIKIKIFGNWDLVFWENERTINDKKFKILDPYLTKSSYDPKQPIEERWSNRAIPIPFNVLFRLMSMGSKIKTIEDNYKEEKKNNKDQEEEPKEPKEHQEEIVE